MSTHSRIAVLQDKTGRVKSVYCHSDGYFTGVGRILLTYYNSYERANAIIALGDLSELYENLDPLPEAPEALYLVIGSGCKQEIIKTHSYQRPQQGVTIAYHRDRQEKLLRKNYRSLEQFNEKGDFQNYNYLFKDGKWHVRMEQLREKVWMELTVKMVERNG